MPHQHEAEQAIQQRYQASLNRHKECLQQNPHHGQQYLPDVMHRLNILRAGDLNADGPYRLISNGKSDGETAAIVRLEAAP